MSVKTKTAASFLILAVTLSAPAGAADLLEIYRLAASNDAEFRAAEAAYQATLQSRPQARAALRPQVNLTGNLGHTESTTDGNVSGTAFSNRSSNTDSQSYSLRLDQVVYNRELLIGRRQADATIAQARAERDAANQALILRVSEAYFDILAAEDNLRFALAEKEAIARQLEQAQKRFEVGLIAITDVKEAQSSFDLAVAQQIDAENQLDISREILRVLTSKYHKNLNTLSDAMPLVVPEPEDIDQWVDIAVDSNLQLAAARMATQSARLEIKRQRSGHHPTVGLIVSKSLDSSRGGVFGDRDNDEDFIGLRANVPIYSGGAVTSRTQQARQSLFQSQELQELQRRETERQARASYLNVRAGISRVNALNQALASSQAAAEATEAGFEVGTRTSVDVLLALRSTFLAQRNYSRSRYDYLLNTLRLKSAAGILGEDDLEALNKWLEQ